MPAIPGEQRRCELRDLTLETHVGKHATATLRFLHSGPVWLDLRSE